MTATVRPGLRAWLPMAMASCLLTVSASARSPEIGAWGFDVAGKDTAVRPGDVGMQRESLPPEQRVRIW